MMNIMVFIDIHFLQDLPPPTHKLIPLLLHLLMHYVRIGKQPLIFSQPLIFHLFLSQIVHKVEVYSQ
jgi:hypothetical protein